ncbi:iron ABC transporter permease [Desulfovibrio sp.]|uniref:FecCD family ABC transporter permease n=1 Tax=Desulfovibrio sp. TaxID=885 RepID=UPI0025C6589C|nr:iron ABC transporter permease [Desulfovibrio sp.]
MTLQLPAKTETDEKQIYAALVKRRVALTAVLLLLAVASCLANLFIGAVPYRPSAILQALLGQGDYGFVEIIAWEIRVPVTLVSVVVGAGLSVAGMQMQTVLNNPLASPFTLGLSAAASFGAALGMVLGTSFLPEALAKFAIPANAFFMAMLTVLFIERLGRKHAMSTEVVILLGTTLVFAFTALLQLLQYLAPDTAIAAVVYWTMGSLDRAGMSEIAFIAAILVFSCVFFVRKAWALTALRLGEARAVSLGIPVARLRFQAIVLSSLLASASVAFVGTIGFIGLIGPHIARMLIGDDQRFLLPASILCGIILLSTASVVSKILLPGQSVPIGIVTSIVGVPLFITLILRKRA